MKTEPGLQRMRPLFEKAGLPEESHEEMEEGICNFVSMMIVVMKLNDDVAPNYITFSMAGPDSQMYELTIRRSDGTGPAECLTNLEQELTRAKDENRRLRTHRFIEIAEQLVEQVAKARGKKGRQYIRQLDGGAFGGPIGVLLDELDACYARWLNNEPGGKL